MSEASLGHRLGSSLSHVRHQHTSAFQLAMVQCFQSLLIDAPDSVTSSVNPFLVITSQLDVLRSAIAEGSNENWSVRDWKT